jgi:hypothetical protein
MSKNTILITSYYPPISYFSAIFNSDVVFIEKYENYDRQTIRNRCYILSANGVQALSVPVIKTEEKLITSVKIDYSNKWNHKHAYAIRSAYGKSPFFVYYYEQLVEPLFKNYETLFELNNEILNICLQILKINKLLYFTETYLKNYEYVNDYRSILTKKKPPFLTSYYESKPYNQVFSDRFQFIADLSILDLIFNVGYEAKLFL